MLPWYNSGMNFATKLAQFNPDPALAEWLLTQFGDTQKAAHQITVLSADVRNKELKIQALTLELAYHKRLKFGAKAEAFTAEQRDLFTDSIEEDLSAMQAELEQLSPCAPRAKSKPTGRKALPAELPRIEHRHEPESCTCGQCGSALVQIAEDISEQLDVEPARFFVHRHIRPQYACRACETVTAAAIPAAIIDGGLGSAWPACLGRDSKISGSFAAVPHRANQCTSRCRDFPFYPGRMDRSYRRRLATLGRQAGRITQGTQRAACR